MAVFSATTSSNKYITIELETRVDGQSVADNTTTISWWLRIKKSSSSTSATWGNCSYAANVGGQQKSGSGNISVSAGGTTALLSGQVTVPHNADGTLTISVSASISGKIVGSVSGTQPMTTIPRASSISAPAFTLGSAGTITINRASSAFTHTIEYWYGNQKGTVVSNTAATSVSWTPPASFASETPSATGGVGSLFCTTYSGGVAIGRTSITFQMYVPAWIVPSISAINVSEAVSGLAAQFGAYVQRKSRLRIQTGASGAYGSSITDCRVTVDGGTYSGTDVTSNIINSSGTVTISATVTDSRGRSASASVNISVTGYTAPAITSLSAHRCNADGSYNTNGDYVYIDYAYNIADVGGRNGHSATISIKRSTGSDWTQVASNDAYSDNTHVVPSQQFLSDYQFDVRLYVADYFDSTTMTARVPTAETILDISADGTAVACGKTAEEANTFDCEKLIIARNGIRMASGKSVIDEAVDAVQCGRNLLVRKTALKGYLYNPDFVEADNGIDFTSDWIRVTSGQIVVSLYDTITDVPDYVSGRIFQYDENKAMIGGEEYSPRSPNSIVLSLQDKTRYIRITAAKFTTYRYKIEVGSVPTDWTPAPEDIADYIVASGTSGIWNYIKYSSGLAICSARRTQNGVNVGTAWGNVYSSGDNTVSSISYPFTFADAPMENVSISTGPSKRSAIIMASATPNTASATASYEYVRGTAQWWDGIVHYMVVGRWK